IKQSVGETRLGERFDWGKENIMSKQIEQAIERYYDTHPTEEDLMGNSVIHGRLIHSLISILEWLLRDQVCAICTNVNFYRSPDPGEYPIVPDIAVIKGE